MESIEKRIRSLPVDLQKEVEDFVDFIIEKRKNRQKTAPQLLWQERSRILEKKCHQRSFSIKYQHGA